MRKPITLMLGEKAFAVRPLTVCQVEAVEEAVLSLKPGVKQARAILAAALARDHAEAALGEIETTAHELRVATLAVLDLAGFAERPPGEATPAGATAPTGESSEAA